MRYRWLAGFPFLYAGAFIAVAAALGEGEVLDAFVRGQLLLVRVLAIFGCIAAARAFSRGDHLRTAWLWLAAATVIVLARDLLRLPPFSLPPSSAGGAGWVIAGLGVASNLALLLGVWLLARAWKVAGIPLPGGRAGAIAVTVVAAALALSLAGPGALEHGARAGADLASVTLFVSAVVDILSLCLLAPLLLTAIALRGGVVAWPWALVTASIGSWLLYDAAALAPFVAPDWFPLADVFRGLAQNFLFAAGVAQRFVVERVSREAEMEAPRVASAAEVA
jgi:hypothetical protein